MTKEEKREYNRNYRQTLLDKGMCPSHPSVPIMEGKKCCLKCLDYHKKLIETGMCTNHPSVFAVEGKKSCQECFDQFKLRYEKYIETKMCPNHPSIPIVEGKKCCQKCCDNRRKGKLRRNYDMSVNDYNIMLQDQNGVCAICNNPEISTKKNILSVDHCHATNKVRALLCSVCNIIIGIAKDNDNLLIASAAYVVKHREAA